MKNKLPEIAPYIESQIMDADSFNIFQSCCSADFSALTMKHVQILYFPSTAKIAHS